MTIKRFLLAGFFVGCLSLIYNYLIFAVFKFYPDEILELSFWPFSSINFYILIFLKNFLVGMVLMTLFSIGYSNVSKDDGNGNYLRKGIFFLCLYAIFALLSFSFGDMFLMRSDGGMFVLITVDGFIESMIATVPIRLFYRGPGDAGSRLL